MNQLLRADNKGTSLYILNKNNYDNWLSKQSQQNQRWLANTNYKGEGLALMPNSQGELSLALFVVEDATHYFSCGELIKLLPPGQYVLQAEQEHQQSICFSWLMGAYKFDRYLTNDNSQPLPCLAIKDQTIVDSAIKHAEATALVRDLVNTPAADMMPINLGDCAQDLAKKYQGNVK